MSFSGAPYERIQILWPDTVASGAKVYHGQPAVFDESVGLPLADGELVGGLGDGEEGHAAILSSGLVTPIAHFPMTWV